MSEQCCYHVHILHSADSEKRLNRDCFVFLKTRSCILGEYLVFSMAHSMPRGPDGWPGDGTDGPFRVLILGHSFIAGFVRFLKENSATHNLALNLSLREFVIQFKGIRGASISRSRANLEAVSDFQPHICILQVGSNDIGSKPLGILDSDWEEYIAGQLFALAEYLVTDYNVVRVIIMLILHKLEPTRPVRYPVDVAWFNDRCDMINKLSAELVRGNEHLIYWKHKGLFELEQLSEALQDDGTHLNHSVGYPKYFKNIRAAIVSARKGIFV